MPLPTLDEMTTWSILDILAHIHVMKEEGQIFRHSLEDGFWYARLETFNAKTQTLDVVWEDGGPDERLLLFDAFGWIWARKQPKPPQDSPWHRSGELTQEAVTRRVSHGTYPQTPDPEDLDPKEVRAVYGRGPNSDKK